MSKTFTDEDGKKYESLEGYTKPNTWVIRPLPQPPAKETYNLLLTGHDTTLLDEDLSLTTPQVDALSKAIEALISYVHDPHLDSASWETMDTAAYDCRKAIQDGSAA